MSTPRSSGWKNEAKAALFRGRDLVRCCFCSTPLAFDQATIEHRIPLSKGGGWEQANLTLSCAPCNGDRGSLPFDAYRRLVRQGVEPPAPEGEAPPWRQDHLLARALRGRR